MSLRLHPSRACFSRSLSGCVFIVFSFLKCSDLCGGGFDVKILGSVVGTMADDSAVAAPLDDFQVFYPELSHNLFPRKHPFFAQSLSSALKARFVTNLTKDVYIEPMAVARMESPMIKNVYDFLVFILVQQSVDCFHHFGSSPGKHAEGQWKR